MEVRNDPRCEFRPVITSSCSSEGVQIGGVCSAAGVVGAWSGAYHKQGWALFIYINAHSLRSLTLFLFLGDPSGVWDPENTPIKHYRTDIPQVRSGSSRRRRPNKIPRRDTDRGALVPSIISYSYKHDGIMHYDFLVLG